MLSIHNLHAGYEDQEILHGVNLTVRPDEIVAIIGPNGAGKSTLLKAVFGQCHVTKGDIEFKHRSLRGLPSFELIAQGVSMVPQGRSVFSKMSVRENLDMGAYILDDPELVRRNREMVLSYFPFLKKRLSEPAFVLSGGQQQMLAIGRALMANPQILLLDEPSLGLAPKTISQLFTQIRQINAEGVGILMVEQNARQAVAMAHKTVVLENGRIAFEGGPEINSDKRLKNVFLGGQY